MPFGQDYEVLKGRELVADVAGDPRTDDVVVTSPDGRLAHLIQAGFILS